MKLVLTCEHGGNDIPRLYKHLFTNQEVLNSHRGFDIGALAIFNHLKPIADFSKYSTTSRLLIELNRSLHHNQLFSEFTTNLPQLDKAKIITDYYSVYRDEVEAKINTFILKKETVLHLSIHSFTPILNGIKRQCDIGILYDSRKLEEKEFAILLKKEIKAINPELNIRFNYPYLGKSDGFTTYLRQQFSKNYIGIEIEVNQRFSENNAVNNSLKKVIKQALFEITHKKNRYNL
ncbi:N-formylglutamate amidohydrolase [Olleya aquimaris]|uniref:Putative N-formylglutamate amidohydrolase n=1 Tax=Olleya aquimaris TaxID=639310 RepID=A0A327RBD3_9FLAO|nr:N-formylglutamate amidohydrolase [Olleya aquimaris]RAJ13468.1 putative N-formylglutamate amidohydrolase [Olleya aquimaris]